MRRKDREITLDKEIFEILNKAEICRVALSYYEQPYIVALNFGFIHDEGLKFYFHCAPEGHKIDIIRNNKKACVQVEVDALVIKAASACGFTMKYRSVIGFGTIRVVTDPKEKVAGMDAIMSHYSDKKEFVYDDKIFSRTTILRMDINEITGKKKIDAE
jgi:nitroimidazol reductase NimA-like FMN-containing flavoprotein (pyridoxamine 5'-phosphate oxidase superfamily)